MMAEIVDHRHAVPRAALLLAAADAAKAHQTRADLVIAQPGESGCRHAHRGIAGIELPHHRHLKRVAIDRKHRALGRGRRDLNAKVAGWSQADGLQRRRALFAQGKTVRIVAIDEHQPVARHQIQEAPERQQNGVQVVKDVRMIELDIVHDRALRQVVEKLRALVEIGRVVLVTLDHEKVRMRESRPGFEVFRHAADHESGILSRVLEDPRQHRRRRRLAVCSAHHKAAFPLDHLAFQHLRHRDVGQLLFQQRLQLGIAA